MKQIEKYEKINNWKLNLHPAYKLTLANNALDNIDTKEVILDEYLLKNLLDFYYHVGIVDVEYKMFANKRAKLTFELISNLIKDFPELLNSLVESSEITHPFSIKGTFLESDDLDNINSNDKILVIDDFFNNANKDERLIKNIINKCGASVSMWILFASCSEYEYVPIKEYVKHVCFEAPNYFYPFATMINNLLILSGGEEKGSKELDIGVSDEFSDEINAFVAYFAGTYDCEFNSMLKYAIYLDSKNDTFKYSLFVRKHFGNSYNDNAAIIFGYYYSCFYNSDIVQGYRFEVDNYVRLYSNETNDFGSLNRSRF